MGSRLRCTRLHVRHPRASERPFVVASHAEFHTRAYGVINAFGSLAHPADVQATDLLMQERRLIEAAAGKEVPFLGGLGYPTLDTVFAATVRLRRVRRP